MGTLLLKLLVGAAAGLLTWLLTEPFAPALSSTRWDSWEGGTVLLLGALVGAAVGGLDGFSRGGKVHTLRGLVGGLFLGAIGCSLGHAVGGTLALGVFGPGALTQDIGIIGLAVRVLARTVAFIPIGIFLGAAIGGSGLNVKKIVQGATGGGIGAAIAGLSFDVVGQLLTQPQLMGQQRAEVGGPSRALFFILLGGLIGLFIGLVERLTRSAWVRLILGRNEGKEWAIDAPQIFLGRSESCAIPLFGDPAVAPVHASITKQGGQYILADGGSPTGTYLNGQRVMQAPLFHGAMIQIGRFTLEFLMRNVRVPQRMPDGYVAQAYPPVPGQVPQTVPMAGMAPSPGIPGQGMPVQGMPTQAMPTTSGSMPTQAYAQSPLNQTVAYGAAPVVSGFALVAMDGPLMGSRFPVSSPIEIGRDSASVPMSYDTNASRRHAAIAPAPSGLAVTDLGSTNGTFVNGQRVQQAVASPGTLIKVGMTTFRVEAA